MTSEMDFTEFGSEEDLRGFDYPAPGTYHLAVTGVDETPKNVDGLKFTLEVLNGTVEGQASKSFAETFFFPSPESKDGGKFAKKRLAKFALAVGIINPTALGSRVQIDWQEASGRQLVAKVENYMRKGNDGREYKGAQISGLDMWRIDAPEVEAVPKDQEALAMAAPAAVGANGPAGEAPAKAAKPDPYADL